MSKFKKSNSYLERCENPEHHVKIVQIIISYTVANDTADEHLDTQCDSLINVGTIQFNLVQ